jgi:hypothetical protein
MTTIAIFYPRAFRLPGHPLLRCAVAVDETREVAITVWEADPQQDTARVGDVINTLHVTIPCVSDLSTPPDVVIGPTVPTLGWAFGTPPPLVPLNEEAPKLGFTFTERMKRLLDDITATTEQENSKHLARMARESLTFPDRPAMPTCVARFEADACTHPGWKPERHEHDPYWDVFFRHFPRWRP